MSSIIKPGTRLAERARVVFRYTTAAKVKARWRTVSHLPGGHRGEMVGKSGIKERLTRKYRPGDNPRRIKWKKLAKQPDKAPLVRLFESQKKIPVVVMVDVTYRDYGTQAISKRELAAALMTSAFRSAQRVGDLVKVIFFSRKMVEKAFPRACGELDSPAKLRGKSVKAALTLSATDDGTPTHGVADGLSAAFEQVGPHKALVFIISDFKGYESLDEDAVKAMRRKSHRHEVVCLKVNDLREWNLNGVGIWPFPVTIQPAEGPALTIWSRGRYQDEFMDAEASVGAVLSSIGWKAAKFGTEETATDVRKRFRKIISGKRGKRKLSLTSKTQEGGE